MNQSAKTSRRYERMKKTARNNFAMEADRCLTTITDDFTGNPEGMNYFYDRYRQLFNGKSKQNENDRVIATLCIHVPVELIYALDAKPVRICSGAYSTDWIGSEHLPSKACPLVKSTLGALYVDLFSFDTEPMMIINPTTCDQKRKLGPIAEELDINFYTLELPPTKDTPEAREYWFRVIKKLVRAMEKVTGRTLTRSRLKKSIRLVARAQAEFRRFHSLRRLHPVILGKDALLISNAFFFDDILSWTKALARLNDELEEKINREQWILPTQTPRILLTGSPSMFPNMKIPFLVEKSGGIVVADEFCSGNRLLYDTVAVDEWYLYDMVPALADRYLKPSTCPNFVPNHDRERKLLDMVQEFAIDGVIYQSFAGCQLYEIESLRIGKVLENNGIPMLHMETDYNPDDTSQLSIRVEAFIEALRDNKQVNN